MAKHKHDTMRVQKYLSAVGFTSRRKAEQLITQGRVKLNGKILTEQGMRVLPGKDKVEVDNKVVLWKIELVYLVLNKPIQVITSLMDPEGRPTVRDFLPENFPRVWPVGRLDYDSDGLVLMTNDGALTHALTHPSCEVDKTYNVKLRGLVPHKDEGLEKIRRGVALDDGYHTSTAQVTVESNTGKHTWVQVILHEGRNRQIRRMAEAVGHKVIRLRRVSIGTLVAPDLPPRAWRFLTREEVLKLYTGTGVKPPAKLKRRAFGPLVPSSWKAPVVKAGKKTKKNRGRRR